MATANQNWQLINHVDFGGTGALTVVKKQESDDLFNVTGFTDENPSGSAHPPWFLGINEKDQVILFDPVEKNVFLQEKMPIDAFPIYSYNDPASNLIWFTFDGDKENGNDELNCGTNGSTVTIIDQENLSHVKTLCLGSGHHVVNFIRPTNNHPDLPKIAYVSNLLSGSISIIGYDETDPNTFLSIIDEINLCEPEKEKDNKNSIPNNAFPHGKQYSDITGKIYSLNNGYGTVAVINPKNHQIDTRIPLKGASNLLLSPCGHYIIGKGADRKSDENHVIGKLSVIDLASNSVVTEIDIPDLYPSTYRFNVQGDKLYVTSAATGKGEQKKNLNIDTLYVYDATTLPALNLVKKVSIGKADCGRRPIAFPRSSKENILFLPNPSEGTLSIIDGNNDRVLQTVSVAPKGGIENHFSFWSPSIAGA